VIYLDHNATTPVLPAVRDAMLPWLGERCGNPSSAHPLGEEAADAVRAARGHVARLVGASPREIVFTSGGTEATNCALRAALRALPARAAVVTSAVEHSATLEPLAELEQQGVRVVRVPVDGEGRLDRAALEGAIDERVALVSLQTANNETGVLFDLAGVAARCRTAGALLHLDAVQCAGKVALDLRALGADYASLSAHKLHGPKGAGALFVRAGAPFAPLLRGGPQEDGRRAGTENVPGLAGFGRAAELAHEALRAGWAARCAELRDRLERNLLERLAGVRVHGASAPRLPNTTNLAFAGLDAEALLAHLGAAGLCASAGSACHAQARRPSHVLVAMGCSPAEASGSLRLSLGRTTTGAEVDAAADLVVEAVEALRGLLSA
jgi:cysteine desulfurase